MPADEELRLTLALDDIDDPDALRQAVARKLGRRLDDVPSVHVRRRSIDARRHPVRFEIVVALDSRIRDRDVGAPHPRRVEGKHRVVIVGAGPAGLFCAYQLARAGIPSVVLDRGKPVQPRRRDLRRLNQYGEVPSDSNYCFGEGGAGTYSDGKLYTRATKRGDVDDVIDVLARHGAPAAIRYEARPHIGSNRLPKVVTAMRNTLESVGVEFRFDARVIGLQERRAQGRRRVAGAVLASGESVDGNAVVLATGHSARDVIAMLDTGGVSLVPKPFALGFRIEHPQPLINEIQYGRSADHPKLPAAYYRLATTVHDRGVFSFCMCPGGWIVPAATEADGLVINGMSLSKRDSPYANSGIVTAIEPAEWEKAGFPGTQGGIDYQRAVERAAAAAGGGKLVAPATRLTDFLARRGSSTVPETSYTPGVRAANVGDVLDAAGISISSRIRDGLLHFGRRLPDYITEEAVLVAVESRTSSPVRIERDPQSLQSPDVEHLYPCGEGAGYAGGIVSAALDGIAVAHQIERGFGA